MERLRGIERNLLWLVLATGALGLIAPDVGMALEPAITPLLALLMLCVAATFDVDAAMAVLRRPGALLLGTALVYVPMSVAGWLIGHALLGSGPLALGLILVGVLPTDASSPLLVLIARGNVALATVVNAVNTGLAPVLVPLLFVGLTGVELEVPAARLVADLALTVLAPTVVGVALRTWLGQRLAPFDPLLSATSSIAYLALLLAVVGPNAPAMLDAPVTMLGVAAAALLLNAVGYGLALAARPLLAGPADRVALLFTVSTKEFSIAAFVVFASGLSAAVALPAAIYAAVQMVVASLVAHRLARRP